MAVGQWLGRYELTALLGRGGMGEVWEAVLHGPAGFRKTVALKVLRGLPRDEAERDKLVREAHLGALMSHPNLVATHELGEHDGRWFIAMELVRGGTVRDLCQGGPLPRSAVLDVGVQVCAGLARLHGLRADGAGAGLVHQDIKPGNLLIDRFGVVKIADFGTARFDRWGADDDLGGTPGYMAPEQLVGTAEPRSDLFSLGVVLFRMATGRRLFEPGPQGMVDAMAVESVVAAPGLFDDVERSIPGLGRVLHRCLRFRPEDRWATAGDLAQALAALRPWGGSGPTLAQLLHRVRPSMAKDDSGTTVATSLNRRENLPVSHDRFVGRGEELAALAACFDKPGRCVTVLGPGGMGKTRLAIEAARELAEQFPDGAYFCDLSDATDLDGVLATVARGLELAVGSDLVRDIGTAIASRGRILVVFDNFEQVADLAEATLGRWLVPTLQASFLVTSRVLVGLREERAFPLGGLTTAQAVELFLDRAAHERAAVASSPSLTQLVGLLDNLPLAIELAAARSAILSPDNMVSRLRDRFQLLRSAHRGRSKRQSALSATIDWSWDLLSEPERRALEQLSVFEGGFSLEAAEAVVDLSALTGAPWTVDVVQALLDKSMLRAIHGRNAEVRFGMYLSISDYARSRLGAGASSAEARHGAYFGAFGTEAALQTLDHHGGGARRRALLVERDNLVVACRRAVARRDGALSTLLICAAWAAVVDVGAYPSIHELAVHALSVLEVRPMDRGRLLAVVAHTTRLMGELHAAIRVYEDLIAHYEGIGSREASIGAAVAVGGLGLTAAEMGRTDDALRYYQESLARQRDLGNFGAVAVLEGNIGNLLHKMGRMDEARHYMNSALAAYRETGSRRFEGMVLANLGNLDLEQGRMDEARAHFEGALAVHREIGSRRFEAMALGNLGNLHRAQGRLDEARRCYDGAVVAHREVGNLAVQGVVLGNLGNLELMQGRFKEAQACYEAALVAHRAAKSKLYEGIVLGNLGNLLRDLGRLDEARRTYDEALSVHREVGNRRFEGLVLLNLGDLQTLAGQPAEARRSYDLAEPLLRSTDDVTGLAGLLCSRAHLELLEGRRAEAIQDVAEAEAIAARLASGPASELGQALAKIRAELR